MRRHLLLALIVTCATAFACASTPEPMPQRISIPSSSPMANITHGMSAAQVDSILGAPTDHHVYVTGKAWIPFYFGADRVRTTNFYKGMGRVVIGGNRRVVRVEYDPSEDGFR